MITLCKSCQHPVVTPSCPECRGRGYHGTQAEILDLLYHMPADKDGNIFHVNSRLRLRGNPEPVRVAFMGRRVDNSDFDLGLEGLYHAENITQDDMAVVPADELRTL